MKFNYKKIASVFASAIMLSSTVGFAAAASTYPAPFVAGGTADGAVVVGANAAFSDAIAAIDVQQKLNALVTSTTSTTGASATGGDAVDLATSSQKVYMNGALNVARTIISKDHLPTLLADGTTYDNSGTTYKYTQTITTLGGSRKIAFSKSGESMDPQLIVDLGYQASAPIYNYTLTFSKTLNVSDSSVVGTATIKMLGQDYTVGANSDYNTLYLYGSGESVSLNEGESKTVTVADTEHTVLLVGTSSTTTGTLEVDGVRKAVTKGSSYKFAGDFEVYIKDVFYTTREASMPSIDVLLGAKTLHFEDGQAVRYGSDDTTILNTNVEIGGTTGAGITSIQIAQGDESATGDYLKVGESYTDRVLGGLDLELAGATPALDSESRDKISVDTDNSVSARVKFTSALAGTVGEKSINYVKDSDLVTNAVLRPLLANDANKTIHVLEGESAVVGDWIVVNDNDEGRILEVISIAPSTGDNDKSTLRDVITGENFDFQTGKNNKTTNAKTISGAEYHLASQVSNADSALWTLNMTWGAGSAAGVRGTETALFPRIKLKNGEWLSFLTGTTITAGTVYSLPGDYLYSTYKAGSNISAWTNKSATGVNDLQSKTIGNVNWTIQNVNNATGTIWGIDTNSDVAVDCMFNSNATSGPAVLIMEEKTLADSNGAAICIPLTTYTSGSNVMPAIGNPASTDTVLSLTALQSNTYKTQGVDVYGTLVERDVSTGTNYAASVSYPDEQMIVDVFFKSKAATVTPGSVVGGAGGQVLVVKDTEVDSVKDKNLFVVGGSCINSVAAKILGKDIPVCGADFTDLAKISAGGYIIKTVESPYNAAKVAMLVAGYNADDTTRAVAKALTGVATDKDTSTTDPVLATG